MKASRAEQLAMEALEQAGFTTECPDGAGLMLYSNKRYDLVMECYEHRGRNWDAICWGIYHALKGRGLEACGIAFAYTSEGSLEERRLRADDAAYWKWKEKNGVK